MKQEEIDKAFENRWRIKGNFGKMNQNAATMSFDEYFEYIKGLCRDFFEAGILLSEGFKKHEITFDDGSKGTCITTYHDPISLPEDDPIERQFNLWWDMYDKKCGRADCLKKWKKLSFDDRIDCMNATPDYVASTPDKKFRKNPLSYINQKAWNDEIIPRNGTDKSTTEQREKLANILAP